MLNIGLVSSFSCSVVSHSLWPCGLQHTRLPCPSSPRACSKSCPLSWWCHPTVSSSVVPCLQSFPGSESFPVSWLFAPGGQSIEASASVLPMNIQDWCPLGLTGWISCSPKDSQESSATPQFKSINFSAVSFMVQLSHLYMTTGKTIALARQTFAGKVMCLCFNILSVFCHSFPSKWQMSFNFMAIFTICCDFGAQENFKSVIVSIVSPSVCYEVMGPDAMIFTFWTLSFKPAFLLSSFTFIKRLFSSSSLSATSVVSFAYLRLLLLLLAILIPACASFSLAFCVKDSAYKLNKLGDNIQPWCSLFPICNQSVVPCPVLTAASWPA